MRAIPAALQAQVDEGKIVLRGAIVVNFPSGVYGFWDGAGPWSWNGIAFAGGASLIGIDAVNEVSGLVASPLTVRLRSLPDAGLTDDVLATIEDEQYHFRPVTTYLPFFDPITRGLVGVLPHYRGRIDQLEHVAAPELESYLEGQLVSMSSDYTRVGVGIRSTKDQERFAPGDRGLEYVGSVGFEPPFWGGIEPKSLRKRKRRIGRRDD